MKQVKKLFFAILIPLFLPSQVFAAPPQFGGFVGIYERFLGLMLPFGGLVALLMMVWGGIMWMSAGGDPAKVLKAQGILTWAVLGLLFLSVFGALLTPLVEFLTR